MSFPHLKLPLSCQKVIDGASFATCDVRQSIRQNLELIILTRLGEHSADETFGCEVWELDFELIASETLWAEKLRKSMTRAVCTHERRLTSISLLVTTEDVVRQNAYKNYTEMRKKVVINIAGIIDKSAEPFHFSLDLYLSPLSVNH